MNGGALGEDRGAAYYYPPRSLTWEAPGCGYSVFLQWACSDFKGFYDDMIDPGCEQEIAALQPERCLFFCPPLWPAGDEPRLPLGRSVPVEEAWGFSQEAGRAIRESR